MHFLQRLLSLIHILYKIEICFLDKDFEHDIYELIKAFYPEAEIRMTYEAEETHFCDLLFVSSKAEGSYLIRYEGEGKSGPVSYTHLSILLERKSFSLQFHWLLF